MEFKDNMYLNNCEEAVSLFPPMGGVYEGPCLTAPNKSKADSVIFVGFTAI